MTEYLDRGSLSDVVAAEGPLPLERAAEVGVAVADLDEALAFYAETFGLEASHVEVNEEQGVREAMVAVGPEDGEGRTLLQLLAPTGPESTIARFIDRSGPGLQQLAYRVADVEKASQVLRDRGLRLLDEATGGLAKDQALAGDVDLRYQDCASFQARACSRPPEPINRTFMPDPFRFPLGG